jgi:hypothetical protein
VLAGSDLIFAKEGIAPLVASYEYFAGADTVCYLVSIRRFEWEDSFFELMGKQFTQKKVRALCSTRVMICLSLRFICLQVHTEGDIFIVEFKKRADESKKDAVSDSSSNAGGAGAAKS